MVQIQGLQTFAQNNSNLGQNQQQAQNTADLNADLATNNTFNRQGNLLQQTTQMVDPLTAYIQQPEKTIDKNSNFELRQQGIGEVLNIFA